METEKPTIPSKLLLSVLCIINLGFLAFALLASAYDGHAPFIIWITVGIWLVAFACLQGFKNRRHTLWVIGAGLLPLIALASHPLTDQYILSWEARHCTKYAEEIELNINASCDSGDFIYIEEGSMKRLFKGGKSKAHFPYSFFYY